MPGYALVKRAAKLHRIFGGLLVLTALLIVVSSLLARWDYRILLPMTTFNELSSTEYKEDVAFFAATWHIALSFALFGKTGIGRDRHPYDQCRHSHIFSSRANGGVLRWIPIGK